MVCLNETLQKYKRMPSRMGKFKSTTEYSNQSPRLRAALLKVLPVRRLVSVHPPLAFPEDAAILAAISAGETPALPGGVNGYADPSKAYSMLSDNARQLASIMLGLAPTVVQDRSPSWKSISTRVTAAVPLSELRMRTL